MHLKIFDEKPIFFILLIWIILTAVNIKKPFQGDDGFHLEAARHIVKDPLHPMTGIVRWDRPEPEPIYKANQPPLFFYMMAAISLVGGFNEIPMHLLTSVFMFLTLWWFHKTTKLLSAPKPLLLLFLFALCPALVVNQNVMTDVPLLALLLGTFYYLLLGQNKQRFKYNLMAVLLLTTGLFIKYTFLSVFAAIACIFFFRRQYKDLALLLIPIGLLILWSIWNYFEYGGIHILQRSTQPLFSRWNMLWSYFSCLGSIATFGLFSLNYILKGKLKMWVIYGLTLLCLIMATIGYLNSNVESKTLNFILEISFFSNGLIIILVIIKLVYHAYSKSKSGQFIKSNEGAMFIMALSLSAFIILLAPFMAPRHVLLIMPFLMWLSAPAFQNFKPQLAIFSVIVAALISIELAISDWQFAAFYRHAAKEIATKAPPNSRIWATGTGGWQWYYTKYGIMEYTVETSHPLPGDYIIVAKGLSHYRISPDITSGLVGKLWGDNITPLTYINARESSMYRTLFGAPSWSLSKKPFDTLYVLQCLKPAEGKH